jgi:hypothetical protein
MTSLLNTIAMGLRIMFPAATAVISKAERKHLDLLVADVSGVHGMYTLGEKQENQHVTIKVFCFF